MYENICDGLIVKKSKRTHRCDWCGEKILKGSLYIKRVYKYDGDFQSSAQHTECYSAMKEAYRTNVLNDGYDGYDFGMFKF